MLCARCGEETPEGSAFCEKCGHALVGVEVAPDAESVAAESESVDQPDIESSSAEEASSDEPVFEEFEDSFQATPFDEVEISVDAISRTSSDDPLVEPPSPPIQPKLSAGRVVIVGTIAVLFAAAVILLAGVSVIRFLGL